MRIVAFDPGGTTGWAFVITDAYTGTLGQLVAPNAKWIRDDYWQRGQLGGEHHQALEAFLDRIMPDIIVCEDFKYRQRAPGSIRMNVELDSVEYIGVIKLWVQKRQRKFGFQTELVMQPASVCNGKRLVTDKLITKLGLWVPGQRHAMDATEHLVYYMITEQSRTDLIPRP
jgi:hypothetical protein